MVDLSRDVMTGALYCVYSANDPSDDRMFIAKKRWRYAALKEYIVAENDTMECLGNITHMSKNIVWL